MIHLYIESSLPWPKQGNAIVGIIFADEKDEHSKTIFGVVKNCTSNQAILTGLKNALEYCDSFEVIHIHLNNSYVAGSFNYLAAWETSGFKNSKGEALKYADLWQSIGKSVKGKTVKIYLNQFNGYYKWLKNECISRGRKHGFIF